MGYMSLHPTWGALEEAQSPQRRELLMRLLAGQRGIDPSQQSITGENPEPTWPASEARAEDETEGYGYSGEPDAGMEAEGRRAAAEKAERRRALADEAAEKAKRKLPREDGQDARWEAMVRGAMDGFGF